MSKPRRSKSSAEPAPDSPPFEEVMQRLEGLVQALEQGSLPLEGSLEAFEEGVALARRAQASLDAMERRIEQLTADGQLEPLDPDDDSDAEAP